jgi:hypothetical protein
MSYFTSSWVASVAWAVAIVKLLMYRSFVECEFAIRLILEAERKFKGVCVDALNVARARGV